MFKSLLSPKKSKNPSIYTENVADMNNIKNVYLELDNHVLKTLPKTTSTTLQTYDINNENIGYPKQQINVDDLKQ
jgi:hypothetical protein